MPSAPWQAGEAGPVTGSPGTVRCANRRTSCRVAIVKSARNRRTPRASRRASGRRWLARGGTAWSRDLAGYGTPWRGLARCWLRFACHRCMPLITHACALCALARSDADLAACGLRAIAAGSPGLRTVLSTQEHRVARLVAQGMTNQEVARELYVSAKTVEGYRPGTPGPPSRRGPPSSPRTVPGYAPSASKTSCRAPRSVTPGMAVTPTATARPGTATTGPRGR